MYKLKLFAAVIAVLIGTFVIVFSSIPNTEVYAGVYNRTKAVAYADAWAKGRNGNYPNYGTGGNCTDCTNYLSQVLNQGGMPQVKGPNDILHWYTYQNIFGTWYGSKSWAATDLFNVYVTQYQATKFQYISTGPSTLSAGDFFLMDLATNPLVGPDHARVIVGIGVVQEGDMVGTTKLLANQHCTDRKRVRWNYNLPTGTRMWAWHVKY